MLMTNTQGRFQQLRGRKAFKQSRGHNSRFRTDQFSTLFEMSTLSASFRKIWSNCMSYPDDKVKQRYFQQSRRRNSKINKPI